MTDNQKQTVRDLRQRGISSGIIATKIGLSANTVRSFCRRENIDVQSHYDDENRNHCKNCGTSLKHLPGSKKKTFCGDKCRYSWWNKNRHWTRLKNAYKLSCFTCGKVFVSNNKKHKFCGRECYLCSRHGEELP